MNTGIVQESRDGAEQESCRWDPLCGAAQQCVAAPTLTKKGQDDPRAKWPGKLAVDPDTLGAQRLHAVAKKADGFIVNDVH